MSNSKSRTLRDVDASSVEAALDEYDRIGKDSFLSRYGYGKAKSYFVLRGEKLYDSKAIFGVAHGFKRPDLGPLRNNEFSGGEDQVATVLREQGFKIVYIPLKNPDWSRDELIVALDFYLHHRNKIPGKKSPEIIELSEQIQAIASQLGMRGNDKFRNENGVYMKLMNFKRIDPEITGSGRIGLQGGAKEEEEVWKDFAHDPEYCREVSERILNSLNSAEGDELTKSDAEASDEDFYEAPEGALLTRIHRVRERDRKIVKRKKSLVLKKLGCLECEVCGFDFSVRYGGHGDGFIECHHTKPLSDDDYRKNTRLSDLALVCSNCHRMIHKSRPWLQISQLRDIIRSSKKPSIL